jgi:hypothetical protein
LVDSVSCKEIEIDLSLLDRRVDIVCQAGNLILEGKSKTWDRSKVLEGIITYQLLVEIGRTVWLSGIYRDEAEDVVELELRQSHSLNPVRIVIAHGSGTVGKHP